MGRLVANLLALTLLALLILPSLAPVATAVSYKTLIVKIDRAKFDPERVKGLGGRVVYVAQLAPVAILVVPAHAAEHVKKLPGVLHVSEDGEVKAFAVRVSLTQPPQTMPWGVDYIDAEQVWSITKGFVDVNGDGDSEIEVAVIDSGVDLDHPDLADNIKWCVAVLNGRISNRCSDVNGHGTHVTGTIAALDNEIGVVGVAPEVEIYMIKALKNSGSGSWSDLIIAIDLAVRGPDGVIDADGDGVIVGDPEDDAPEVISMSLGGYDPPPELQEVIAAAYSYGIVIVAAAGNEGLDTPAYPAAYPEVIAVGAIDENATVPDWSNRNPEVTAPGVDILSTYPDDSYAVLSGTSMATPHVSGTVALIQAARLAQGLPLLPPGTEDDLTTDTVRGILHLTAVDLGDPGYDTLYGYGVINAYDAVLTALNS
ncbi:peptidase S8 and S53 subtilisin kexin sedolisin [Pyrolobus fumarii 1A]|uniref:Peptidase S8 and S53 subtilisin kexin sedolisin n=1 Tax=Pyrolobus fumarii (strain DSM 11204 / 1A) TaxID=694429 RepID=G0EFG7_PYRF1|nr:S8 family peptidase [Pyrolobus fumarii]AEM38991.1 peptidase S8 and S53 subtilisin kexin sedolisin [Pyrolobus fumarii 1A]